MKTYYEFKNSTHIDKVKVEVEVIDTKFHFGRKMCLVTPVAGEGEVWVNCDKVKITK